MSQGFLEKKKEPEHKPPVFAPKEFAHGGKEKKKEPASPISPSMSEGLMALRESAKVETDARARYEKFLRIEIEALKKAAMKKKKKRLRKRKGKRQKGEDKPPEK